MAVLRRRRERRLPRTGPPSPYLVVRAHMPGRGRHETRCEGLQARAIHGSGRYQTRCERDCAPDKTRAGLVAAIHGWARAHAKVCALSLVGPARVPLSPSPRGRSRCRPAGAVTVARRGGVKATGGDAGLRGREQSGPGADGRADRRWAGGGGKACCETRTATRACGDSDSEARETSWLASSSLSRRASSSLSSSSRETRRPGDSEGVGGLGRLDAC